MAAELDVGTEVAVTCAAVPAHTTGVGRLHDDPLPCPGAGNDDTAHLVTEHERLYDDIVTDAAVLVPMQVRAAEPHGGDAYELFAGCGDGLWFLVDTDVIGAV